MAGKVEYRVEDGIAVLTVDNPPVNALSHEVRQGLVDGLDRALADEAVHAIVLAASGRTFPAGADINEFGGDPQPPLLPEVCARIEASEKPVVAAIGGTALGGGFELALAAHYRLADENARVGLPEVTLGLLPGAGGTQRVPRLAGADVALDVILGGRPMTADDAAEAGLIDGVVEGDLEGAALSYAEALVAEGIGPRPTSEIVTGFSDPAGYLDTIAARRKSVAALPIEAPRRIVDCVEAALLMPMETGLAFERAAFEDLLASESSDALRHMFFAERRAARFPGLEGVAPRPVARIAVVGGGTMGRGIVVACLNAGYAVKLIERDTERLERAVAAIIDTMDRLKARGTMSAADHARRMERLSGATEYGALGAADLVIEAVPEDLTAKKAVFEACDAVMRPGAVLASNTSYLDIDLLAAGTRRAGDVLGLHFFAPAHVMRLVEVVVGARTAADVVATGLRLARALGKIPVRSEVGDGFIANRILSAYRKAADVLLEEGGDVAAIDAAMRGFGFPLGPYQVADLTGLDIAWARRKRLAPTRDPEERYVAIADVLCERGRFGQKVGRGYYRYEKGQPIGRPDPEVGEVIRLERTRKGIVRSDFTPDEIARRCVLAMANEGARLLDEGIALRPSDIDVAAVHGLAFPRWKGGPMKWADRRGLIRVKGELEKLAPEDRHLWEPSRLILDLVRRAEKLDHLNADAPQTP